MTQIQALSSPAASHVQAPEFAESLAEDDLGQMLLVFRLQGEIFALTVDNIHAVIDPLAITTVPNAPDYAPGLINFRGQIIPVIDLRKRLAMPPHRAEQDRERMIVIDQTIAEQRYRLAFLADSVDEVIEADLSNMQTMPELGARWPAQMIKGIAQNDTQVIILLNPETLFAPDAIASAKPV